MWSFLGLIRWHRVVSISGPVDLKVVTDHLSRNSKGRFSCAVYNDFLLSSASFFGFSVPQFKIVRKSNRSSDVLLMSVSIYNGFFRFLYCLLFIAIAAAIFAVPINLFLTANGGEFIYFSFLMAVGLYFSSWIFSWIVALFHKPLLHQIRSHLKSFI